MKQVFPHWLEWAREIQALSQSGRHYAQNDYDRQRYIRFEELAAEIISTYTALPQESVVELYNHQVGYATPRVDVRGAVFNQGRILMVRERMDGRWTLPGGWADVGDVPSEAAEREVWEEAGMHVKAKKLIGVYDANRSGTLELFHAFKVIFLCELLNAEGESFTPAYTSFETSEVKFFAHEEIPTDLSSQRTNPRYILDAYRAYQQPDTPTVFD